LYHFTRQERLAPILREGITRGDVAIAPDKTLTAPWLTVEGDFSQQVWAPLLEQANSFAEVEPERALKTELRFTVVIPPGDIRHLHHWLTWAENQHINTPWLTSMIEADGGHAQASRHWFYKGVIKPEWITATELRDTPEQPRARWGTVKRGHPVLVVPSGQTVGKNLSVSTGATRLIRKLRGSPARTVVNYLSLHRAGDYGAADLVLKSKNQTALINGSGTVTSRFQTSAGTLIVHTILSPHDGNRTLFLVPDEVR
jgi:hypothetical protein